MVRYQDEFGNWIDQPAPYQYEAPLAEPAPSPAAPTPEVAPSAPPTTFTEPTAPAPPELYTPPEPYMPPPEPTPSNAPAPAPTEPLGPPSPPPAAPPPPLAGPTPIAPPQVLAQPRPATRSSGPGPWMGSVTAPLPPVQTPNQVPDWVQQLLSGQTASTGAFTQLTQQQQAAEAQRQAQRQAFEDQIRQQVMGMLRANQGPVDVNALTNTPEAQTFKALQQRQLERYRADQAEARGQRGVGAVSGGNVSGALAGDITQGEQGFGERTAAFEANLVANELRARRDQLTNALRVGAGIMSNEQEQQLRRELAANDNALRGQLGRADIGLRGFLGGGQLSNDLLRSLMQNQQFYDELGYNLGGREAENNQIALRRLMGGGYQ